MFFYFNITNLKIQTIEFIGGYKILWLNTKLI